MRRILITPYVLSVAGQYASGIERNKTLDKLNDLISILKPQRSSKDYISYIQSIIHNYDKIIVALPGEFDGYNPNPRLDLTKNFKGPKIDRKGKPKVQTFHSLIVDALRYDWVRNYLYPKYICKLGIKTCVYCNAQYGISLEKGNGEEYTSSFQIDHSKPKSQYPYLATSFFNLLPSCSHCNQMKSQNPSLFNLYTTDPADVKPFDFKLDKASIVKYLLSCDPSDLKLLFGSTDIALKKNHEDRFRISLKYANHVDEAADLVVMSRFYNKAYLSQLQAQFGAIAPLFYKHILNVLIGFPSDENDIHKRPLTLMRQDIAKQLGIL